MVTLEQVGIRHWFNQQVNYYHFRGRSFPEWLIEIEKQGIENGQQLLDYQGSRIIRGESSLNEIDVYLGKAMKMIERLNEKEQSIQIYSFPNYAQAAFPLSRLQTTDRQVKTKALILESPTTIYYNHYGTCCSYPIALMKELLGHIDHRGRNALVGNSLGIGPVYAEKIARAIYFYEEQVLRQAAEHSNLDTENYFSLDYEEKRELLLPQMKEIADMLVEEKQTWVWGTFSDIQKQQLLESFVSITHKERIIQEQFQNMVINYTTLSEARQKDVKTKILKRWAKNEFSREKKDSSI